MWNCVCTLVALIGLIGNGTVVGAATVSDATAVGIGEERNKGKEPDSQSGQLAEVIVTAQKRSERLEDVPAAVTVVNADALIQQGALYLQDYYATVPGLAITDLGNGQVSVMMRGLSTGFGNPTVGITVDDVPIGQTVTADVDSAVFAPQFDPADLQSIQFLKGPQGALYGASSLGGVVKYVTVVPDFTSTSGHIEVDTSGIPGGGAGYGLRGSVNVPVIADTVAIRASAFARQDPGFVDDPTHGESNLNSTEAYGGRVDALWQATQMLSVRVAGLIQRSEGTDGSVDTNYLFQPIQGGVTQDRLPGTGGYSNENQLYTATLNFRSHFFDVTSISAYSKFSYTENQDASVPFGASAEQFFGVQGAGGPYPIGSDKFSEEIRFSSPTGAKVEWQFGGFYTSENISIDNFYLFANLQTGAAVGFLESFIAPSTYHERAAFGDLTYHFTDRFSIQVGGRESQNWQHYSENITGPLEGAEFGFSQRVQEDAFTYLVAPQLKLSDSVTAYARVASGYQPGGPNTPSGPGQDIPRVYDPSTTVNYELGLKSRLFDRRVSIDADVFYIKWLSVQLEGLTSLTFPYFFNGHGAKSEGAEVGIEFKPIESVTISGAAAFVDAVLTGNSGHGFPGVSGDSLLYSSRFTGSLSVDDQFRISHTITGFAGATAAYVGKRYEAFPSLPGELQPSVPAYSYGNAHAGIITKGYTITTYVKNISNERGILFSTPNSGSYAMNGSWRTTILTPRTLGISVSKAF